MDHSADEDSSQGDNTQVEQGTGQGNDLQPSNTTQGRPKKRGSLLDMANFKFMVTSKKAMGGDSQEHPAPVNHRSKSMRCQKNLPHAKRVSTKSSVNIFDKVAAERFSKRGSFLTHDTANSSATFGSEHNRCVESLNNANDDGSSKAKVSVKDFRNNLGGGNGYNKKISSILYARQY